MRLLLAGLFALSVVCTSRALDRGDLNKGAYPGLKLVHVGKYDVASFKGRIELPGRFIAEWSVGVDSDQPNEKTYTFWPAPEAVSKLPHWADYVAKNIDIENGASTLVMFAGANAAADFEQHKVSKVIATGTAVISTLKVWVECDAPNARAHVVAAKDVTNVTVNKLIARVGCNGPYDI